MTYTFDYEETLVRRIRIDADNIKDAMDELYRRIDEEEIVLNAEDFAMGKISMPIGNKNENFFPQPQIYGEDIDRIEGMEIVLDYW